MKNQRESLWTRRGFLRSTGLLAAGTAAASPLAALTASPAPAGDEGAPPSGALVVYTKDPYLDDSKDWFHEGYADRPWIKELWNKYRPLSSAPTDGWKQKHDDSYYRNAVAKQRKK